VKILVISSRVPAAEKKGDQVVSFFRVMYLVRNHEVELICFGNMARSEDREARQVLESAGVVVHFVKWKPWVAAARLLQALPDNSMPFQCAYFRSGEFEKVVDAVCLRFMPDALYCVLVRVFVNAADFEGRIYVDMVDSMGLNFSRRASMATGLKRWVLNLERSRVTAFEMSVARRADRSFVVSRIDQNAIGEKKVEAIPLGIDMGRFKKEAGRQAEATIAFTGNMGYQPNIEAVQWFVNNCWPEVKRLVTGVQLVIAGSNPHANVVALADKDKQITVTGRVPSVAAILNGAKVALAPMQSGSGMQFKILEAMACGVPVVTTALGLGDISARPGKDILVADSSAEFTQAIVGLLKSVQMAEDIGDHGMQYVYTNHSWNALNERFAITCGIESVAEAKE
jgi:polysaccharide biosynthesis protein PslH